MAIAPLLFSYLFVGVAFGVLAHKAGFSARWAVCVGLVVYAGSMQIVMISLLASGDSLLTTAIMTLFVNGRHVFYGIGFVETFRRMGRAYPYMALTLTDETYSLLSSLECPQDLDQDRVMFLIAVLCHCLWVFSCAVGALLGRSIPGSLAGIEFSATAFFATAVLDQGRRLGTWLPSFVGAGSAVGCILLLGREHFLLPALTISLVVLFFVRGSVTRQLEVRRGSS